MSIWKYDRWLPQTEEQFRVTRGEAETPLVRSVNIGQRLGVSELYFKLENLNPTGSYKDRFAALVVSQQIRAKNALCITTSSGNTGAAVAAYCAAAQLRCIVITVDGAPPDKLLQMQSYGAEIYEVSSFGKDSAATAAVFDGLAEYAAINNALLPISAYRYCPDAMRGVETMAYEILEKVQPEHIFSPAGGGGLTLAVARGSQFFCSEQLLPSAPKIHCVQPIGNDTIATALKDGSKKATPILAATTTISGLQVPGVLDGEQVVESCRRSGGTGHLVEDDQVYFWQSELAQQEGIFCEPAGAVALAGLVKAVREKVVRPSQKVVCLVTGSGFKNMEAVKQHFRMNEVQKISVRQFHNLLDHSAQLR